MDIRVKIYNQTTGATVYQEKHTANSGPFGVVNLVIGNGTESIGTIEGIEWDNGSYDIGIEMKPANTGSYTAVGDVARLVSVPYAMHASTASYAASAGTTGDPLTFTGGGATTVDTTGFPNIVISSTDNNTTYTAGAGIAIDANNVVTNTAITPAGTIVAFGGTTAPAGWLLCDGDSYPASGNYQNLFNAIGSAYGGSGNSFNVPDFRGRFLRGVDGPDGSASDRDPNSETRTAMNIGGNPGNLVGSVQDDAFQGHGHAVYSIPLAAATGGTRSQLLRANNGPNNNAGSPGGTNYQGTGGAGNQEAMMGDNPTINSGPSATNARAIGGFGTPRVANETRPVNAYVNYIIKL